MDYSHFISACAARAASRAQCAALVALAALEASPALSTLSSMGRLTQLVKSIAHESAPAYAAEAIRERDEWEAELLRRCAVERSVLSCPHNDEFVVLLSALKFLEQEKECGYADVLKEVLQKHLHKLKNFSTGVPFIGRAQEIENILRVLSLTERNNVLIIGSVGVGKTALAKTVMHLAMNHETAQLFPGTNNLEEQALGLVSSGEKKHLFLLDEIFSFPPAHIGSIANHAQIIATSGETLYRKFSSEHPGIIAKFDVLVLEEPKHDELRAMLSVHKERIARELSVVYEDEALPEVTKLARQHIAEPSFPAKGISLLEESAHLALRRSRARVNAETVREVVAQKANLPLASLTDFDKKDLSELDLRVISRVKGQDHAVQKIVRSIQRSRLGLARKDRPVGSFLLVGPSGVGKTELTKTLAEEMYGGEDAMIRIDMSEYSEPHTVQRLIGAPPGYIGYEEGGQLTNPIKNRPFSLVLLDEIEKAHPKVFDVFLQVLDDGRLTDGRGKLVDFRNTMIIATSNAGIEDILDLVNEGKEHSSIEKEVKDIMQDYFRIEFLNRFDDIVVFKALDVDSLVRIAELSIRKLTAELESRGITLTVKPETLRAYAEAAYDPRYGARGLQRVIQERLENPVTELLMTNRIGKGGKLEY